MCARKALRFASTSGSILGRLSLNQSGEFFVRFPKADTDAVYMASLMVFHFSSPLGFWMSFREFSTKSVNNSLHSVSVVLAQSMRGHVAGLEW